MQSRLHWVIPKIRSLNEQGASKNSAVITTIAVVVAIGLGIFIYFSVSSSDSEETTQDLPSPSTTSTTSAATSTTLPENPVTPDPTVAPLPASPVPASPVLLRSIASSRFHVCGISDFALNGDGTRDLAGTDIAGTVYCWGENSHNQLGVASTSNFNTLQKVPGISGVTQVAAGRTFTCARQSDEVYCWGGNAEYQLAIDSLFTASMQFAAKTPEPQKIPGVAVLSDVTKKAISLSAFFACGITEATEVVCWGNDYSYDRNQGELKSPPHQTIEIAVGVPLSDITYISAGESYKSQRGYVCAVRTIPSENNALYCWGNNTYGELGSIRDVGFSIRAVRATAPNLNVQKVSTGFGSTCIIADDASKNIVGGVWCWGLNHYGQVGVPLQNLGEVGIRGSAINTISLPQRVAIDGVEITGALDIKANGNRVCIITSKNELACWGYNRSKVAAPFWSNARESTIVFENDNRQALTPSIIPGVSDVQEMIVTDAQTCIINSRNAFKCFGADARGLLGPYEDEAIQTALGNQ